MFECILIYRKPLGRGTGVERALDGGSGVWKILVPDLPSMTRVTLDMLLVLSGSLRPRQAF